MSEVAKELRKLAETLEWCCTHSPVSSIALPAVQACCDYLTLRARVIEIERERDAWVIERRELRAKAGHRQMFPSQGRPQGEKP